MCSQDFHDERWSKDESLEESYDEEDVGMFDDLDDEMDFVDEEEEEDYSASQDAYEPNLNGESSKSSTGFGSPSFDSSHMPSSAGVPYKNKTFTSNNAEIEEQFSQEEMDKMKERVLFELNVKRRRSPEHWASPELQELIKNLKFFPDQELNRLMSKLLLTLSFYNQAVSASIVAFFGPDNFKEYYLPNSIESRQSHANKPPLPKFRLFHLFWRNINGTQTIKTFKTIIIITNFHLRRMPPGYYDGNLQKPYKNASETNPSTKSKIMTGRPSNLNRSLPEKDSKDVKNSSLKTQYQTRQPVSLDDGGNAYFVAMTGQKYFVNNPDIQITFEEFFKPSRLLCMKARAYAILKKCEAKNAPIPQPMKYAPEAMNKMTNLSYFPDEKLNQLMSQVMFIDHSIYKMVQITSNVFWSDEERAGSIVPYRLPYSRLTHPPIIGHEFYYEFWDNMISFRSEEDRKKIFEYAICNMNKFRLKEPNSEETNDS